MNRTDESPEDLVVLARRVTLNQDEQQALRRLLASSQALRTALNVGQDFDRVCDIQVGDEARMDDFVSGAIRSRARLQSRFWPRLRVSRWLLAAAVFGASGVAFGLRGYFTQATPRAPEVPPSATAPGESPARAARTRARAPSAPTRETSAVITPDLQASAEPTLAPLRRATPSASPQQNARPQQPENGSSAPAPSANPNLPAASASTTTLEPSEPTAASLFATANLSRNQRHFDLAAFQFRELQRRFSGTPEAVISFVSLGKLHLTRGDATAALEQFTAYTHLGGPLMEEALIGRAQALFALGRTSEELRAWEILLTQFPRSVYAVQARNRLATQSGANR